MLRYSIIYGFFLVVAFVAAQTDNYYANCIDRAAKAAGCPPMCVYFHPSARRPPPLVDIVLLFRPY